MRWVSPAAILRQACPESETLASLLQHAFKDRQLLLRSDSRVVCFNLSARAQVATSGFLAGALVWALISSFGFLSLVERWHGWSRDVAAIQQERQAASDRRRELDRDLERLRADLIRERRLYTSARRQLLTARDSLSGVAHSAAQLDRDRSALSDRVAELEQALEAARDSHHAMVEQLSARMRDTITSVEQIVSSTGMKVERLAAGKAAGDGKGGPLVPLGSLLEALPDPSLRKGTRMLYGEIERWQQLVDRVERLPLAPPLTGFRVTSGFGVRHDPFTGEKVRHLGLDLAAPAGTRIRAPGPGRVVRAGWDGSYGRMVEIDHGNGLRSRYAHLQRILVNAGQRIDRRDDIGSVGSSGRSTGSHLHYELLLNGRHLDPGAFLRAHDALQALAKSPLRLADYLRD